MVQIVVTHDFGLSSTDIKRLQTLGEVRLYDDRPNSAEDWLERTKGADIICSGISGLTDGYQNLKNVFISLPMVGHAYLDKSVLKANNVTVSNSPGCNTDAVAEWVTGMMINLLRDLPAFIDADNLPEDKAPRATFGLVDRRVFILGKGHVGTRVGEICSALKMNVSFLSRGDDLLEKVQEQEVIVNCLSANESSSGLLNETFFDALFGVYFVSIASNETYDTHALFKALEEKKIIKAAIDDGTMPAGRTNDPYYQKLITS